MRRRLYVSALAYDAEPCANAEFQPTASRAVSLCARRRPAMHSDVPRWHTDPLRAQLSPMPAEIPVQTQCHHATLVSLTPSDRSGCALTRSDCSCEGIRFGTCARFCPGGAGKLASTICEVRRRATATAIRRRTEYSRNRPHGWQSAVKSPRATTTSPAAIALVSPLKPTPPPAW